MSDELRQAVASIRECARAVLVESGRFDGGLVSPFDGVATRDAWKPVQAALRTLQNKLLETIYDAGRKDGRRMPLDMVPAKLWPRDLASIRGAILKLYELSPFVDGPASQAPHEMAKTICCQLAPLVEKLDGKATLDAPVNPLHERDAWIYQQMIDNPYNTRAVWERFEKIRPRKNWPKMGTAENHRNAFRGAANRHANRLGLPEIPKGRGGRPKGAIKPKRKTR